MQTVLILLIESGLVFLGLQVSRFYILLADARTQDTHGSRRSDRRWSWFSVGVANLLLTLAL